MGTSFEESRGNPQHPFPQPAPPGVPHIPAQRQAPPDPPPPPEPVAEPRRWPWLLGGVAAGLLIGGAVGATALSTTTVVATPPVTVTAPAPRPETITVTVAAPAPVPAAVVEPTGPLTTFGAGVWEVGVDVAPGKYKTTGTDGYGCYYARLEENDGSLGDILANGFVQGPATVTIKEADGYFETSGCEEWVRAG